jgi:serine/threonine protein kinase
MSRNVSIPNSDPDQLHKEFIQPPRYHFLRTITRGGQGGVYLVFDIQTGKRMVIKLEKLSDAQREQLAADILPFSKRPHLFLHPVAYIEIPESTQAALVSPYVHGESLWHMFTDDELAQPFSNLLSRNNNLNVFLSNICLSVAIAHDVGIVHSDLSYGNIMVYQDGKCMKVILIDFGFASAFCKRAHTTYSAKVNRYDPRMSKGIEFPAWEADIYSLGFLFQWIYQDILNIKVPDFILKNMIGIPRKNARDCATYFQFKED